MSTRVSVLGSWRKGKANVERGSGLYLKRYMTNNHIQVIVVHEGDGLMEYEGYEYIGPLDIAGPAKTTDNTEVLQPGYYLYKGAFDVDIALIRLTKEHFPDQWATYVGPIFNYCPPADDIVIPKGCFYSKVFSHTNKLYFYTLADANGTVLEVSAKNDESAKELFKQGIAKLFMGEQK